MIIVGFKAELPRNMRREFNKEQKENMLVIGQEWHRDKLPLHFERNARQRYSYPARDKEYETNKRKARKGTADNVFWGKSKRWSKYTQKITSTARQTTIRFSKPQYRPESMNDELTRINTEDRNSLASRLLHLAQISIDFILHKQRSR